jgi:phosphoglycolate phosphatase-like HAD superfamily hydrolase
MKRVGVGLPLSVAMLAGTIAPAAADPLPSWHEGPAKTRILTFVKAVADKSSPDHVVPERRIAVFDNDGTLWSEQPLYFQLQFAIDRVRSLALKHPEWRTRQPFKAVLEKDLGAMVAAGEKGLVELVKATHAGMTTEEFETIVSQWLATARHPRFDRPYTDLVYQPMLELLAYLRANDFKTYIVSGGGIEFMRPWVERVYGIPPEQVVGSSIKVRYEVRNGAPVLVRLPEVDFIDDKAGEEFRIPRKVVKGGSHLCAPNYCLRYRPAARQPQMVDTGHDPPRVPLHRATGVGDVKWARCPPGGATT